MFCGGFLVRARRKLKKIGFFLFTSYYEICQYVVHKITNSEPHFSVEIVSNS